MSSSSPYRDIDIRRVNKEVAAGTTDAALWVGEPGYRCRVVALHLLAIATTAVDINTKPIGSAGTSISGTLAPELGDPILLPFNPHGWFESESGEGLTVTTGAGQTVTVNATIALIRDTGTLVDFLLEDESEVLLEN